MNQERKYLYYTVGFQILDKSPDTIYAEFCGYSEQSILQQLKQIFGESVKIVSFKPSNE